MSRRLRSRRFAPAVSAVAFGLCSLLIVAQSATPAAAQKRVALVVGNSAYTHAPALPNPVNDAADMAAALKEIGITVILGLDLDKPAFDAKIREFSRAVLSAEAGILFYAGHGLRVGDRNYLVPIDAQLQSERDLDFEAVALDFIMKQMEIDREGKTNIVFLDACRDNPLARNLMRGMGTRSVSVGRGLAEMQTGVGTFIAYATRPGEVALDGEGRNSPFTGALVKHIRVPGRSITVVMAEVRKDVLAATGKKQQPHELSALTGDVYLAGAPAAVPKTLPSAPGPAANNEATEKRLRELEEQLKRKSDPQLTVKLVELTQLKERVRQSEEANRQDMQLIFETNRKMGAVVDPDGRMSFNREIAAIHRRIAERGQQQKTLREQITKLEGEVNPAAPAEKGAK